MKLVKSLLAAAALTASVGANAVVTGSLGGGFGPFIPLTTEAAGSACVAPVAGNNCALGPLATPVATIVGGTIYNNDVAFADDVAVGVPFLAAGPSSTTPSVMTFSGAGVGYVSFLWGSPDTYNLLTVTDTNGATFNFTTASLGFPVQNGDQSFNQYVQFAASGFLIRSLTFTSNTDAFETTNYSLSPIPEPETYALMLAGLAALGFVSKRRKQA